MMLHPTPHPGLSARLLLSDFDAFISDAKLEALYNGQCPPPLSIGIHISNTLDLVFESVKTYPAQAGFGIILQAVSVLFSFVLSVSWLTEHYQIREPYKDLCIELKAHLDAQSVQLKRLEVDKRDFMLHLERLQQDKRDLMRQRDAHSLQLEREELDKRDLLHHIQQQADASKLTNEAHARQIAQLEQQLVQQRVERADAIASERQSSLIVQNHLLSKPRLQPPKLSGECLPSPCFCFLTYLAAGSVTRATRWQQLKNSREYSKRPLPFDVAVAKAIQQDCAPLVQVLLTKYYANENAMYTDFLALFEKALTDRASYHDTSRKPYLNGMEPDLTLALYGVKHVESVSVLVLVEVKRRLAAVGTDAILGQLLDYLFNLMAEQAGRRFFTAVVSNVSENVVVTMEVTDQACAIVEHHTSTIYQTLAYLHDTSLVLFTHRPPTLGFAASLGPMEKRLGHSQKSVVGQFSPAAYPGTVIAVKRASSVGPEIMLLRRFANDDTRPPSIPLLLYQANDLSEFGITPVGIPLVPGAFANNVQARAVIEGIHSALTWLHTHGIVHRDVRCDNVIIDATGRGVLIDFDSACDFRRGSLRVWNGGYLCCPPRLIREVHNHGWLKTYAPSASDDWHAFVLMVNCLVFPTTFVGFQSKLVGSRNTTEAQRLLALWDALTWSLVWGPFVHAAAGGQPEVLVGLADAFVWL